VRDWREQLGAALQGEVVVMGIGNPWRGDDGAGSLVAQRLSGACGVHVIDAQEVPENYLSQIVDYRPATVVLIDAADLSAAPGTVALVDRNQMAAFWPSTHRVPLSLLADYLERETGAHIFLVAIQPEQTAFLQGLSTEVAASVEDIAGELNDLLGKQRSRGAPISPAAGVGAPKGTGNH
jgi:hydrogenase 3 maturation protease